MSKSVLLASTGLRAELPLIGTLADGTAVVIGVLGIDLPRTVWVRPTNGDTVSVEYTVDGTNWTAWVNGTASAYSVDTLSGPVQSIRFTRATGSGVTSGYGIQ